MISSRSLAPFAEATEVEVRTDAIELVVTAAPDEGLVLEATPRFAGVELWTETEDQGLTHRVRLRSRAIAR